uniref:Uncharacterized protein n=1 Tax=Opuntia streptacantha TaxID=393608 RepID=A0A7C9A357_OPUST
MTVTAGGNIISLHSGKQNPMNVLFLTYTRGRLWVKVLSWLLDSTLKRDLDVGIIPWLRRQGSTSKTRKQSKNIGCIVKIVFSLAGFLANSATEDLRTSR